MAEQNIDVNELNLTQQEINLILTRRELQKLRQAQGTPKPKELNTGDSQASQQGLARPGGFASNNPQNDQERLQKNQELKKNPKYWDKARPQGWDAHCNPCQVHKGRLTPGHPMYWFEENVFRNISNKLHQEQHKKIKEILGMPVQANSRDRMYHTLCHMDVLWTEGKLPVSYKKKYEDFKKKENIGDDNIHPAHKKPGVEYPVATGKRPWTEEDMKNYDENEVFKGDKGKGRPIAEINKREQEQMKQGA